MIVNVVFHGAWLFIICEAETKILAVAPKEADHNYGVGSIIGKTFDRLEVGDYEFLGVDPYDHWWYPNSSSTPMISARNQGLKLLDPDKKRYCKISLPFPRPFNIFALEPYNTVGFLNGKAAAEVSKLVQFPAVHCFTYECSALEELFFTGKTTVSPRIRENPAPYDDTANLHIFATYWAVDLKPEEDRAQMERCFHDMTHELLSPPLDLKLDIDPNFKIQNLAYGLPPGLTQDEVEMIKPNIGIEWGSGHNCQNTGLFIYDTGQMEIP